MKREIKFRGKRLDNGEWIYGDLVDGDSIIHCNTAHNGTVFPYRDAVDPETVGQYTERKDKNEVNEIYEDDIMFRQIKNGKGKVIREYKATVVYVPELAGYYLVHDGSGTMLGSTYEELNDWAEFGEVIGNVHENPEFMEGKK